MDDRLIDILARLIEGLQVPRSLRGSLGAGEEAYDDLRAHFRCAGWQDREDIEARIRRKLKE